MSKQVPDSLQKEIRSVLLSKVGGVPINKFIKDYRTLVGSQIDYRSLGFRNLTELFQSIPEVARVVIDSKTNLETVYGVTNNSLAYLNATAKKAQYRPGESPLVPQVDSHRSRSPGSLPPGTIKIRPKSPPPVMAGDEELRRYANENIQPNMKKQWALCFPRRFNIIRDEIDRVFSKYGDIAETSFTDKFVFIRYNKKEDAVNAFVACKSEYGIKLPSEKNNPRQLIKENGVGGKPRFETPRSSNIIDYGKDTREDIEVFFGNLPLDVTEKELWDLIQGVKVHDIKMRGNETKRFAFALVTSKEDVKEIVSRYHQHRLRGYNMVVQQSFKEGGIVQPTRNDQALLQSVTRDNWQKQERSLVDGVKSMGVHPGSPANHHNVNSSYNSPHRGHASPARGHPSPARGHASPARGHASPARGKAGQLPGGHGYDQRQVVSHIHDDMPPLEDDDFIPPLEDDDEIPPLEDVEDVNGFVYPGSPSRELLGHSSNQRGQGQSIQGQGHNIHGQGHGQQGQDSSPPRPQPNPQHPGPNKQSQMHNSQIPELTQVQVLNQGQVYSKHGQDHSQQVHNQGQGSTRHGNREAAPGYIPQRQGNLSERSYNFKMDTGHKTSELYDLFVANFPFHTSKYELMEVFGPYGASGVQMKNNSNFSKTTVAFAQFRNYEDAVNAFVSLDGVDFYDRPLRVNFAHNTFAPEDVKQNRLKRLTVKVNIEGAEDKDKSASREVEISGEDQPRDCLSWENERELHGISPEPYDEYEYELDYEEDGYCVELEPNFPQYPEPVVYNSYQEEYSYAGNFHPDFRFGPGGYPPRFRGPGGPGVPFHRGPPGMPFQPFRGPHPQQFMPRPRFQPPRVRHHGYGLTNRQFVGQNQETRRVSPGLLGESPHISPGLLGNGPQISPGLLGARPQVSPGLLGNGPQISPGLLGNRPQYDRSQQRSPLLASLPNEPARLANSNNQATKGTSKVVQQAAESHPNQPNNIPSQAAHNRNGPEPNQRQNQTANQVKKQNVDTLSQPTSKANVQSQASPKSKADTLPVAQVNQQQSITVQQDVKVHVAQSGQVIGGEKHQPNASGDASSQSGSAKLGHGSQVKANISQQAVHHDKSVPNLMTAQSLERMMEEVCPNDRLLTVADIPPELEVLVVYKENDQYFWGQIINDGFVQGVEMLYNINKNIQENPPSEPAKGKRGAVLYQGEWTRAWAHKSEGSKVQVMYVDYGNTETIQRDSLLAIPESLWKLAPQAVPFRIKDPSACTVTEYVKEQLSLVPTSPKDYILTVKK